MKNIVKMVIVSVILIMAMMMSGFAYEKEKASDPLTRELIAEGFVQNENDSNIWECSDYAYVEESESLVNLYAVYNVETNIGVLHMYGDWTVDGIAYSNTVYVVQWNVEANDFEILSEMLM